MWFFFFYCNLSRRLKLFLCSILTTTKSHLLISVLFFSLPVWAHRRRAFFNWPYTSLTHLSTSDLNPDHGSVPTNRATRAWIALFHPLSNALPFWTNVPKSPASRICLIFSQSHESFFVDYRHTIFNKIVHFRPLERRQYSNSYSVVLASNSSRACFYLLGTASSLQPPLHVSFSFLET